jgi:hypothetical protein
MSAPSRSAARARRPRGSESEPQPGSSRAQGRVGLTESERAWLLGQLPVESPSAVLPPREPAARRYRAVLSCTSCPENSPEGKA